MDDSIDTLAALRPRLQRIAYRILGSHVEARTVVDSVSASFRGQALLFEAPVDSTAWLVSATSRVALDRWREGETRPESPDDSSPASPSRISALTKEILASALAILEQIEPDARVAFLLHDIFSADLRELASTLGRSESDCRALVERARQQVRRHRHRRAP